MKVTILDHFGNFTYIILLNSSEELCRGVSSLLPPPSLIVCLYVDSNFGLDNVFKHFHPWIRETDSETDNFFFDKELVEAVPKTCTWVLWGYQKGCYKIVIFTLSSAICPWSVGRSVGRSAIISAPIEALVFLSLVLLYFLPIDSSCNIEACIKPRGATR